MSGEAPVRPIDETATVNRVIHEYPHTRRVFEELRVDVPAEGCDCLDEVAWRHGMDVRELLAHLELVIGFDRAEQPALPESAEPLIPA
jgi:hypothetical protein